MSSSQLGRNEKSSSRCVNWGHSMALNHLPPKSPSIPSIPTPSTSASSTSTSPYPGCAVRVPGYGATAAAAAAMAHHHHNQHHHHHRRSPSASFVPDVEPSWLEELLDSPKAPAAGPIERPSHRRSASDSFAFLEAPSSLRRIDDIAEEDEFYADREEQLASMFSDALKISSSSIDGGGGGGSMWQDRRPGHNSLYRGFSGDLSYGAAARMASEAAAAELDEQSQQQQLQGDQTDIKRSKRQSAQRSRVRKLQYIHELEGNVSDLQNEVSGLSTQVALVDHQLLALHLDNAALKQSAAALAQEARIRDAHTEALTKEIQRLSFLKQQQQQQQRLRQQLALASASTAASAAATSASAANNVETTTATKHVRRASAGSVHDLGSASDVLDYSFVKFVEKTDSPVLRSSCTLAGNGKSLEVGAGRLSGAPPGFVVHNHL